MADPTSNPPSVPRVPAGKGATPILARPPTPGEVPGLPRVPGAKESVIPHGGNSGGRPRLDGLVPGSAEATAADKKKEAQRSQRRRDVAAVLSPAGSLPPISATPAGTAQPPSAGLDLPPANPALEWTAADLQLAAADCVNLWESATINKKLRRGTNAGLARATLDQIVKDSAFPSGPKQSLQNSSPATLAKLFNALRVPLSFKPIIATCPAFLYLLLRDLQQDANVEKLIAAMGEPPKPAKPAEGKK